ncbi:MAG: hypothetical protein JWN81_1630 [Solirubrobacterales bacterium]|nr:hypothetical protein [Solirubrobacterales bacterium]
MSGVATSPGPAFSHAPAGPGAGHAAPGVDSGEACPLCATPLQPEQEWCLSCGAAARTRLAASPNWRAPIAAIVAVLALSLGVLTAALVDLAGSSSPTRTQVTRTVTTAPAAAVPAPVSPTTTSTAAPPATVVPAPQAGAKTTTTTPTGSRATAPTSGGAGTGSTLPGVTQPGTRVNPTPGR